MGSRVVLLVMLALLVGPGIGLSILGLLDINFYFHLCPDAQTIVSEEVAKGLQTDIGIAAGLVRMHFHDCFVRGCDGSVLLDSTTNPPNTVEKDSPANNPNLRGFEVIYNAKARLEVLCPGRVSCADILAFAARDSIAATKGFWHPVPCGRRDGRISLVSETFTNLPPPTFNVSQLTQAFANKGFTQDEMVTLSGAHTLGRSHCTSFRNRLYNFNATMSQDPSLDPQYAAQLKLLCPKESTDLSLVVPMNPISPDETDVGYYQDILESRGLFSSDQTLLSDPATASRVSENAGDEVLWRKKFAAAIVKMSHLDILTGSNGEIRRDCRMIN